jgi:hypothetical protein
MIMEALPGASILATHLESGTRYGGTDFSGNFRISNMRVEVRMKFYKLHWFWNI